MPRRGVSPGGDGLRRRRGAAAPNAASNRPGARPAAADVTAAADATAPAASIPSAAAPRRASRGKSAWWCLFFVALCIATSSAGYLSVLRTDVGRDWFASTLTARRSALLATPLQDRGALWRVRDSAIKVFLDLPLFIAHGGERKDLFARMQQQGTTWPMAGGVAISSHAAVTEALMDASAAKGVFIGAQPVPGECMGENMLIFRPCGERHTRRRELVKNAIKGFHVAKAGDGSIGAADDRVQRWPLSPPLTSRGEYDDEVDEAVRKTLIRTLYTRMFGAAPSDDLVEVLYTYYAYGGTCILGTFFHKVTFGTFASQVQHIRDTATDAIAQTPAGKRVVKLAVEAHEDEFEALQEVTDGFLFAGLFGTGHLATHTLRRIATRPMTEVQSYRNDKRAYLVESARVDPPVTSVTVLARKDYPLGNTMSVANGGDGYSQVPMPAGTTIQAVISTANTDPSVFGGPSHSEARALQFDPTRPKSEHDQVLSWNALEGKVGEAPRGCPGHDLALQVARDVIDAFLPAEVPPGAMSSATVVAAQEMTSFVASASAKLSTAALAAQAATEDDDTSMLSLSGGPLDAFGHFVWLVSCLWGITYLRSSKNGYGPMSARYTQYLIAQAALAFAHLAGGRQLYTQAELGAGLAYMLLFLRGRQHRCLVRGVADDDDPHSLVDRIDLAVRRRIPMQSRLRYSGLAHLAYFFCAGSMLGWWLAVGESVQAMAAVFYSPCAAAAVYTVVRFYAAEPAVDHTGTTASKRSMGWAVVGGIIGVFNLFWPAAVSNGQLYHLLGRCADATAYVPLVLPGLLAMDTRVASIDRGSRRYKIDGSGMPANWHERRKALRRIAMVVVVAVAALFAAPLVFNFVAGYSPCPQQADWDHNETACRQVSVMRHLDVHSRTTFRMLKAMHEIVGDDIHLPATDIDIPSRKRPLIKQSLFFGTTAPVEEEDIKPFSLTESVTAYVKDTALDYLRLPMLNPLVDTDHQWPDLELATSYLYTVGGRALAQLALNDWSDTGMVSDRALAKWAFVGLAAHTLTRRTVPPAQLTTGGGGDSSDVNETRVTVYESDFLWMQQFGVRPGYERYGAKVQFSADRVLQRIEWPAGRWIEPGHADWEHAKWVWKCSVIVGVTAKDHLVGLHIGMSNFVTTAAAEMLSADHPIRRLLRPHTWGAIAINRGALKSLFTERGLLHRAVGFTWPELRRAIGEAFRINRAATARDYVARNGLLEADGSVDPNAPWAEDLLDFDAVVYKHVSDYVDIYYASDEAVVNRSNDAEIHAFWEAISCLENTGVPKLTGLSSFKRFLADFIVHVTGVHQHVGNVAEYLTNPTWATAKIRPGREVADVQSSIQSLNVGMLTALPAPLLLNDFKHVLLDDEHVAATRAVFDAFQTELRELMGRMDARNEQRAAKGEFPCNAFHPGGMTSGVNI